MKDYTLKHIEQHDIEHQKYLMDRDLSLCLLKRIDLHGIKVWGTSFYGSTLEDVDLSESMLSNVDFRFSTLINVNVDNTMINETQFYTTTFINTDLSKANLTTIKDSFASEMLSYLTIEELKDLRKSIVNGTFNGLPFAIANQQLYPSTRLCLCFSFFETIKNYKIKQHESIDNWLAGISLNDIPVLDDPTIYPLSYCVLQWVDEYFENIQWHHSHDI